MSKSSGNVVDPFEFSAEWGSDALRYYLLSEIPNGKDGDFSKTRFEEIYNSHLANGLGNLVSRVVAMGLQEGGVLKLKDSAKGTPNFWDKFEEYMNDFDFCNAIKGLSLSINAINRWITEDKPWEKEGEEKRNLLLKYLELIRQLALAFYPFIPQTSEKIAAALGVSLEGDFEELKKWGAVKEFKLSKPGILFPKKERSAEAADPHGK
jgi:methionyl-tRNA synthetase